MLAVSLLLIFSYTNKHVEFGKKYPGESIQIKVAAYNVEFGDKGTVQEIGEKLKPYNFDVVCFSEAPGGGWTKEVGAVMGLNHVVVGKIQQQVIKTNTRQSPVAHHWLIMKKY